MLTESQLNELQGLAERNPGTLCTVEAEVLVDLVEAARLGNPLVKIRHRAHHAWDNWTEADVDDELKAVEALKRK